MTYRCVSHLNSSNPMLCTYVLTVSNSELHRIVAPPHQDCNVQECAYICMYSRQLHFCTLHVSNTCGVVSQAFSRAHRIGQSNKVSDHGICMTWCVVVSRDHAYSALGDWLLNLLNRR